jgi:hypothetical protein
MKTGQCSMTSAGGRSLSSAKATEFNPGSSPKVEPFFVHLAGFASNGLSSGSSEIECRSTAATRLCDDEVLQDSNCFRSDCNHSNNFEFCDFGASPTVNY